MNNNRGNNRRRGRGNNRPQGGGQQLNRIDSRARGNAPQMLEKYRKLAHDAHLNGDRVQAEYYLQFADHYFRVIADTRLRQEEARARRDDRWQENGESWREEGEDSGDFSVESDFPSFDQPPVYTRREREDRGEPRRRDERRDERPSAAPGDEGEGNRGEDGGAGDTNEPRSIYEPAENPFLRENRGTRGPRRDREAREERRPRRDDRREPRGEDTAVAPRTRRAANAGEPGAPSGLDASMLPPAISPSRRPDVEEDRAEAAAAVPVEVAPAPTPAVEEAPAPAPKRRTRRKPASDAGETLESVG